MMKEILLFQIALLSAIHQAVGFQPRVSHSHGRIGTNALLPPLHSTPIREKEYAVQNSHKMNDSETTTKGWTANLMQMFGINGDRKVNHMDSSAVAALAFLSWTLLCTPAMANDSPHTPSSSSSSSSSSRSVSTPSSRTSSSTRSSTTRSSSSISSSASRRSSSTASKSSQHLSTSTSKNIGNSSPSQATSTPKTATTSSIPSSNSNPSTSTGKRVVMSSPKSSSARLNVKPKVAAETASFNSNTKKAGLAGERVTMQTPKSSSARLRPPSSSQSGISSPTKAKTKVEVESPKSNTNTVSSPPKSASSAKASSSSSTSTPKNSAASPVVKKKDPSSPPMKETTLPLQKDAPTKKSIVVPSKDKSGSIASKKDGLKKPPTKASNAVEKAKASSESTDKNTPRKRSGQRVGGRAAKRSESKESTPTRSRETIIRNNYIIRDAPPARYYFPPRNIGTAYYYNDYAPPLQRQQSYPLYRRPMCASSESNKQKLCPLKLNEPIDVLVDNVQGLYVQGSVTFINQETFDFTVTYSSPDGYPIQKTFPAVPQKVF